MITVPWAWLIGMFINPGFLPWEIAKWYGVFVFGAVFLITTVAVYRYWCHNFGKSMWAMTAAMLLGCQIYWWWALACGNQGAIAACAVLLVICLYQKHPVIGGLLMTVVMIKPQLAAIFYLIFLLEKEYKVILVSFLSGLIAFLSVVIWTGESFVSLLLQTFQAGSSLENVYFGLFDILKYQNISVAHILLLDVGAGIIYTLIYWRYNKYKVGSVFSHFSGVAIASSFWFYKQPHDNIIFAVPCLAALYLAFVDRRKSRYVYGLGMVVLMIGSFYIQGLIQHLIRWLGIMCDSAVAISVGRMGSSAIWIVLGGCMLFFTENTDGKCRQAD